MITINYAATLWFYYGEESLGEIQHETPPRIGDHVHLRTGTWKVVGVWWQYPDVGSMSYAQGDRGGIVTIQCVPGDMPFPDTEAITRALTEGDTDAAT